VEKDDRKGPQNGRLREQPKSERTFRPGDEVEKNPKNAFAPAWTRVGKGENSPRGTTFKFKAQHRPGGGEPEKVKKKRWREPTLQTTKTEGAATRAKTRDPTGTVEQGVRQTSNYGWVLGQIKVAPIK